VHSTRVVSNELHQEAINTVGCREAQEQLMPEQGGFMIPGKPEEDEEAGESEGYAVKLGWMDW
jgi:hypothetical protein